MTYRAVQPIIVGYANANDFAATWEAFYTRDVVSGVFATATWLGGWVSVTAGIVSKRLNLS